MNPANSIFLLNWINSNAISDSEKVLDIMDQRSKHLLLRIFHLIDKHAAMDVSKNNEADLEVEQVLSLVLSYLGGFHHLNINAVINNENLIKKDELEIGKVITLLLCSAILCDNVAVFIDQITKMNDDDQFTFKFLVESVLAEMEHGCLTAESFASILSKKVHLPEHQRLEQSPLAGQDSPVEALFTNSPLKSFVASPQLRSKHNQIMMNKLQQKVSKLQSSLDLQVHVQAELETELSEKNKEIDSRDANIIGLRSEITKLLSSVEELDHMRHLKEEYERVDKENVRLKQKVAELQTFRQQCDDLEQKVASFIEEKEQFEKERIETERLNSSIERYKSKIHHLEFQTSELQATLNRKDQTIAKLQEDFEEVLSEASKSVEMRREIERSKAFEVDDVLTDDDSSATAQDVSLSHAPIATTNVDTRIIELELEKRRLMNELSSAVHQEEYLALKETLEVTKDSQSSYKESYVLAKSRIQELEEKLETEKREQEKMVEQLKNVQQQCFQEVEELKSALFSERSLKKELAEELDLREKTLQETNVEIQALATLKTGLEGSLQTSNVRAADDRAKFERDLSLSKGEVDKLHAMLKGLEKEIAEKSERVHTLELEKEQVKDAYEQMLADVRNELDSKRANSEEEKAAALVQSRLKVKQLEDDYEKMKDDFGKRQKAILEEANRNREKIQEACDVERTSWKKKFNQLSEEVMKTRSEMFENSKKHAEEVIEIRRKAREREEQLEDEARIMREEKENLENQLLRNKKTFAELEEKIKRGEATEKELDDQKKKCAELKEECSSLSVKGERLEANVEQIKRQAELEKEQLENERKVIEEASRSEICGMREAIENLKEDYSKLDVTSNEEIESEKKRRNELSLTVQELKTLNDEKEKRVETLEGTVKEALEEKENLIAENKSSQIEWQRKQQVLENKIEELETASKEKGFALAELKNIIQKVEADKECLEQKAQEDLLINRRLTTEIHSLEAQLARADQQIREQRQEFKKKDKMEPNRRQTMGGVIPKMYQRPGFLDDESSTDSEESVPLKIKDLSDSLISNEMTKTKRNNSLNKSDLSFCSLHSSSASSFRAGVQTRSSRRQSAIYVRRNTPPERRTINSEAYFIVGSEFVPEMEQDTEVDYDWNRLAELQRRNASCPPHLQTSYPLETQMGPNIAGQEEALKTGRMSLDSSLLKPCDTRKRKSGENARKAKNLPKSVSAPNITPAKRSRSQRLTQAMQSAVASLRSRSSDDLSKEKQEPEVTSSRRESLAFSIEITPPKATKKAPIERRRTISRHTGTSRLLGLRGKESLKKSKTLDLAESAQQQRKPLKPRQEKK